MNARDEFLVSVPVLVLDRVVYRPTRFDSLPRETRHALVRQWREYGVRPRGSVST